MDEVLELLDTSDPSDEEQADSHPDDTPDDNGGGTTAVGGDGDSTDDGDDDEYNIPAGRESTDGTGDHDPQPALDYIERMVEADNRGTTSSRRGPLNW